MLTIDIMRDGRSLTGLRKLYKIRLESRIGHMTHRNLTARQAAETVLSITQQATIQNVPHRIADHASLPTIDITR